MKPTTQDCRKRYALLSCTVVSTIQVTWTWNHPDPLNSVLQPSLPAHQHLWILSILQPGYGCCKDVTVSAQLNTIIVIITRECAESVSMISVLASTYVRVVDNDSEFALYSGCRI